VTVVPNSVLCHFLSMFCHRHSLMHQISFKKIICEPNGAKQTPAVVVVHHVHTIEAAHTGRSMHNIRNNPHRTRGRQWPRKVSAHVHSTIRRRKRSLQQTSTAVGEERTVELHLCRTVQCSTVQCYLYGGKMK
jgi:hypothetical protein